MRASDDLVGNIGRTWREEGGELTMAHNVRIRVSLPRGGGGGGWNFFIGDEMGMKARDTYFEEDVRGLG